LTPEFNLLKKLGPQGRLNPAGFGRRWSDLCANREKNKEVLPDGGTLAGIGDELKIRKW